MSAPSPPALQFVHTELHEVSEEKSHRFHEKNQAITSEDLWRTWHQNKGEGSKVRVQQAARLQWDCRDVLTAELDIVKCLKMKGGINVLAWEKCTRPLDYKMIHVLDIVAGIVASRSVVPHLWTDRQFVGPDWTACRIGAGLVVTTPSLAVFQWTNDDVIFWLEGYVELPQYSEVFRKHNITGRVLPR